MGCAGTVAGVDIANTREHKTKLERRKNPLRATGSAESRRGKAMREALWHKSRSVCPTGLRVSLFVISLLPYATARGVLDPRA